MKSYLKSNKIINKYLLYATLFALPWQVRNIVDAVYFNNNFIEYSSTSIYFTDILIMLVLFTWIPVLIKLIKRRRFTFGPKAILWPLLALLVWMWLSIIWASNLGLNHLVSVWMVSRFTLFSLFYLYLINSIRNLRDIIWPVVWGLVLQSVIAISQYVSNSSLGLRLIGESILAPAQSGIPVVIVDGIRKLRAHGSFPHANILGGFLAVWLTVLFSWFYVVKRNWQHYLVWGAYSLLGIALVLSFSRAAWLAFGICLVVIVVLVIKQSPKKFKKAILPIILSLTVVGAVAGSQFEAVTSRFDLDQPVEAISLNSRKQQFNNFNLVFSKFPLLGVGAGQYVPYLYKLNQETQGWSYSGGDEAWKYDPSGQIGDIEPMHNIYLLILAELGVVGLAIFGFLIYGAIKEAYKDKKKNFIFSRAVFLALIAILILGLFDHYLWTLQQGRLLWFIILALVAVLSLQSGYNNKVIKR